MPEPIVSIFRTCKQGESLEDCQDNHKARHHKSQDGTPYLAIAVSDGATESFLPSEWSRVLAERFSEDPAIVDPAEGPEHRKAWLKRAQEQWRVAATKRASNGHYSLSNNLKSEKDAAATLAGLVIFYDSQKPIWFAATTGDSCIFHLSHETVTALPLDKSEQFGYSGVTALLSYKDSPLPEPQRGSPYVPGDVFVVASDAIAKWLLKKQETGTPAWGTLFHELTEENFETFVYAARQDSEAPMDNDDVTLAIVFTGPVPTSYDAQRFDFSSVTLPVQQPEAKADLAVSALLTSSRSAVPPPIVVPSHSTSVISAAPPPQDAYQPNVMSSSKSSPFSRSSNTPIPQTPAAKAGGFAWKTWSLLGLQSVTVILIVWISFRMRDLEEAVRRNIDTTRMLSAIQSKIAESTGKGLKVEAETSSVTSDTKEEVGKKTPEALGGTSSSAASSPPKSEDPAQSATKKEDKKAPATSTAAVVSPKPDETTTAETDKGKKEPGSDKDGASVGTDVAKTEPTTSPSPAAGEEKKRAEIKTESASNNTTPPQPKDPSPPPGTGDETGKEGSSPPPPAPPRNPQPQPQQNPTGQGG